VREAAAEIGIHVIVMDQRTLVATCVRAPPTPDRVSAACGRAGGRAVHGARGATR
jgi:hypothetical protein